MPRLTKREAALCNLVNAPLDHDVVVPAVPAKRTHPEADLHKACASYLRLRQRQGHLLFHSNLPEGKRNPKRAGWFHAMNGLPGFPDITILKPGLVAKWIFIELKSPTGRLTPEQEQWSSAIILSGYAWHLVRSVDELPAIVGPK